MKSMNSLLLASTALLALTALSPTAHADVRLPGVLAQAAPPASSGDADKKAPANADKKAPAGEAEKKKEPEKKEQKPAAAQQQQQQQQQAPKQAAPAAQQKPADAGAATPPAAQQPKSAQSAPDRAQRRDERSEERQERRQERKEERREDRGARKGQDSAAPSAAPNAEKKQTDKTDKPERADKAGKAAADKAAADKAAADKAAADKAAADKADKTEKQESPASRSPAAQSKSPDAPDAKQPAPAARSTTQQPTQAAPGETPSTKSGSPEQPAARSAPQQSAPDAAKSANPTSPQQAAPGAAPSATPGAQQQGAAPSSAPAAELAEPPAKPKDASAFIRRSDKEAAVGLDDLRRNRREFREGNRVVIQEGNRLIVREGDRTFIRHNALERFAVGARDVRVDRRRGGETETIFTRPNGVTIVTVTDEEGHMLRRVRRDRNGREIVIFDNREARGPVFVHLPPPRIRIPRERYILEAEHASPTEIYEVIMAPPVEEIERHYTVEQVRYSDPLRDRMPRVDLAINFETGSWQLTPDQVDELSVVAKALNRALERNPREVFLIEGHTDAVGSDDDNLSLSDRRAETVAVALTEQFQVPPENLVTQGYGEQYLKVETEGPSRENRRVSVRRITPLMAEQQAQKGR